jgi:predicted alpha/beta-hydrolase family hydrolase
LPTKPFERDLVRGWLHEPVTPRRQGLVITHGAGSHCGSPLLLAIAEAFAGEGFHVLRCDLPYRQERPAGPPPPGSAERDREGLRRAAQAMREITPGFVLLGGHSYGGRQSTILAAEAPELADALLLLSYPLHPPRKPDQLRTQHFPRLQTPGLFVHGARDPFGAIEEMQAALTLIPARHHILTLEKTGHELSVAAVPAILRETVCFHQIPFKTA